MDYFIENEKRLRAAFLLHDITRAAVSFDGSGDSGQIDHVALYRNGQEATDLAASLAMISPGAAVFNPDAGQWETGAPTEGLKNLADAVEQHVYDALERSGVDWYNNDGGYGEWVWEAGTGLSFDIRVRVVESSCEHSEARELGETDTPEDGDTAAAEAA